GRLTTFEIAARLLAAGQNGQAMPRPHQRETRFKAKRERQEHNQQPRGPGGPRAPSGRPPRGSDGEWSDRGQDEPHALALRQAKYQEGVSQPDDSHYPPWRPLEQKGGKEEQEERAELVREAVETRRLECHGRERGEQVKDTDRQGPLDWVEHLIES